MSMDRLVELFVQSALEDESGRGAQSQTAMSQEAVERGVTTVEKMLTSEEAGRMVGSPCATFVCLGMAMEDKPRLQSAATRCYEKAIEYLDRLRAPAGSWERIVVLQQLGAVCLRQKRFEEAMQWLADCSKAVALAEGHPRDAVLFQGSFSTGQTRMEFAAMVEKLRAKTYHYLGDNVKAHTHLEEAKRLEAAATGDAVERQIGSADQAQPAASGQAQAVARTDHARLWSATPAKEVTLKTYRWTDEGSTVLVTLDLNDHLGIGASASDLVDSIRQFRVRCEADSVDVQLRLERETGEVWHFALPLRPLSKEIVPEDTVPKLRGKPGKRRLEITLFKREKSDRWFGDLLKDGPKTTTGKDAKGAKAAAPTKGSLLNPLTPEELAALPKPSGGAVDNRPSTYAAGPERIATAPSPAPAPAPQAPTPSAPSAVAKQAGYPAPQCSPAVASSGPARPPWVAAVEERTADGSVEFVVRIGDAAGDGVSMEDLELDGDTDASVLRLRLLRGADGAAAKDVLELQPPQGADVGGLSARWRRKTRQLELRMPLQ